MTNGRIGWVLGLVALGTALGAGEARTEINVTGPGQRGCPILQRRVAAPLRRALRACEKRPPVSAGKGQTFEPLRCFNAAQSKLQAALARRGCSAPRTGEQGPAIRSTGTYHAFAAGTQRGNIIFPDPDDPSTTVTVTVSPANRTIQAGESTTFDLGAQFTGPDVTEVIVVGGGGTSGTGFETLLLHSPILHPGSGNTSFRVTAPSFAAAGVYEFHAFGLTSENKYTPPAFYTVTIDAPATPPAPANTGTVNIANTNLSAVSGGDYPLSGAQNEVGALFDNENDHIVNSESGSNTSPYPRFPELDDFGGWTLRAGRRYADQARLIVWARLGASQFVAAHLNIAADGTVSAALLSVGDLADTGVVESTDQFEVQLEGALPTSGAQASSAASSPGCRSSSSRTSPATSGATA